MPTDLITQCEQYVTAYFQSHQNLQLTYHNLDHTESVYKECKKLLDAGTYTPEEHEAVLIAAWFHDIGYLTDTQNHEEKSVVLARDYLLKQQVPTSKIEAVCTLIMATKIDWQGDDRLAWLLRDADLNSLSKKTYFKISESLRIELNNLREQAVSHTDWLAENIRFFEDHRYQSPEGRARYSAKKAKNYLKLKTQLEQEEQTISSSKSAQTQIKTALRNNIDLSAIADNKANIMLSVNALIITVGLPLLLAKIGEEPALAIPTGILTVTSVVSMVFATLSTRPIKMGGKTDLKEIPQQKTNLFFFGNYYKMKFDEYETGLKQVIEDEELMDNSIARDLFFLGVSLGKKFEYLRYCYNFFMAGIICTVASFVVTLLL